MDRALNPKDEKQTIYEIYRACRLCGAGAGYKMPIIQNVVDLDGDGIELRQKIKECVQIEVNHTDRMPPLICELCVDKVNEFHDFLTMCKQSNRKTRLRLGLPLHTPTHNSVDSENCVLSATEPVLIDSDAEPPPKNKNKKTKAKKETAEVKMKTDKESAKIEPAIDIESLEEPMSIRKKSKKDTGVKTKIENPRPSPKPEPKPEPKPRARESREPSEEPRWTVTSRGRRIAKSPSPKRTTRQTADIAICSQRIEIPKTLPPSNSTKTVPKKIEETLIVEKSKLKRTRNKEVATPPPPKRVKTAPEPVKITKPGPRSFKNVQQVPKELPVPKLLPKSQPTKPASRNDRKPSPVPQPPTRTASKAQPSKAAPSKATPSKALPAKAMPSKAAPSKALPSRTLPSKAPSSPDVPKAFFCQICKTQMKNSQGFSIHNIMKHLPNFTSPKHACNACELWFSTVEEANTHHRNHRNQNIPYKCTRCYGYFKLQQAYEEHFGNELCLSVYEVPDVKCWECWRTFPTNRLLEEHHCLGEDARAGGKCNKCSRNYALLKNLLKHESTCTYKKKGEVTVDPDVQARMLPMQVRVARCDPLIKTREYVDSSKVPHTYGLDSKYVYPYLPNIKVKSEPQQTSTPHMVSINEETKDEFCDSYVHWDSDSDVSDSASVDTDSSQKKVNTLSTISLKTIFSKKCMGKVPRKLKLKNEAFDSFNDFGMGKKIDNIIENLSNDDTQTTCSYDSDSILENNLAKDDGKTKDVTEKGGNDSKKDENSSPITVAKDDSQTSCDSDSILDKNIRIASKNVENDKKSDDMVNNVPDKQNDTSEQGGASEKSDVVSEKLNNTPEKPEKDNSSDDSEKVVKNIIENDDKDTETIKEKEDLKSLEENIPEGEEILAKDVSNDVKLNCDTESSNNVGNCQIDDRISQNNENKNNHVNNIEDSQDSTENVTSKKDSKNDDVDSNTQFSSNIECLNKNNELINSHSDKNDFEKMEVDEKNELVTKNYISKDVTNENNMKDSEKPIENNEIFSKIDEITSKILKENQTSQNLDEKLPTYTNDDNHHKSDPYSDSISLHSIGNEVATDNQDKFNVNDLNEDDQRLMAELDAQIGENEQKISENNKKINVNSKDLSDNIQKSHENHQKSNEGDKKSSGNDHTSKDYLIDNLLKKPDLRSLDLDSISDDEFNFDI